MKKKILLSVFFMLTMSMKIAAQNDGFFSYQSFDELEARTELSTYSIGGTTFGINQMETYQTLPVGNGILLLASAGLAYLLLKKKEDVK